VTFLLALFAAYDGRVNATSLLLDAYALGAYR
jgi:hypothetical protein